MNDDTDRSERINHYWKPFSIFFGLMFGLGLALLVIILLPGLPVVVNGLIVVAGLAAGLLIGIRFSAVVEFFVHLMSFFT